MEPLIDLLLLLADLFRNTGERRRRQTTSDPLSERQKVLHARLQHPEQIRALLRAKRKIQAIKIYRQETDATLKEAKCGVEYIESEMQRELGEHMIALSTKDDGNMQAVWHYLRLGKKIEAIKAYREATGASLQEAKSAVDAMTHGAQFTVEAAGQTAQGLVDPDTLRQLVHEGRKIEAIKYFRQQTGASLREAKEAVEWLEEEGGSHR